MGHDPSYAIHHSLPMTDSDDFVLFGLRLLIAAANNTLVNKMPALAQ